MIEKKEILDINDIKLLSIANRMEDIYRTICKSTDQFITADQFQTYNNKLDVSHTSFNKHILLKITIYANIFYNEETFSSKYRLN